MVQNYKANHTDLNHFVAAQTSAKTGDGVKDLFESIAREIVKIKLK